MMSTRREREENDEGLTRQAARHEELKLSTKLREEGSAGPGACFLPMSTAAFAAPFLQQLKHGDGLKQGST
jgi:hypothetical protein